MATECQETKEDDEVEFTVEGLAELLVFREGSPSGVAQPNDNSPHCRTFETQDDKMSPLVRSGDISDRFLHDSAHCPRCHHDPGLERYFKALVDKGKIPPPEVTEAVHHRIQQELVRALEEENYNYAEKLHKASELLRQPPEEVKTSKVPAEERLKKAKETLSQEEEKWEGIRSLCRDECQRHLDALKEKQKEEEEKFISKWSSPEAANRYRKASSSLIQLRKMQRMLASSKDYSQAKIVKREADYLSKAETADAESRFLQSMQTNHDRLMQKHTRELDGVLEHQVQITQFIESSREKALHPHHMLIRQLEHQIEEQKPTNLKPRPKQKTKMQTPGRSRFILINTPRTAKAFCEYKKGQESTLLEVPQVDVKRALRGYRPATSLFNRKVNLV